MRAVVPTQEKDNPVAGFVVAAVNGGFKLPRAAVEFMPGKKLVRPDEDGDEAIEQRINGPVVLMCWEAWQAAGKTFEWADWRFNWDGFWGALRDGLDPEVAAGIWLTSQK